MQICVAKDGFKHLSTTLRFLLVICLFKFYQEFYIYGTNSLFCSCRRFTLFFSWKRFGDMPTCHMVFQMQTTHSQKNLTSDFYCNHIFPSLRSPFHNCPTDIRCKIYFKDIHTELLIIDPFSRLENQEYIFIPPLNSTFKKLLLFIVTIMYG